jgi:hypothetical protein|tara:strand:+ start:1526 stop:1702 length:177 start_codon:yes stop_codon:yes gene_type:complete
MRFEIRRQIYRKSINELSGNWYTDEQYRKYEIYDTKKEKWITIDKFAEIAKEKEIGNE